MADRNITVSYQSLLLNTECAVAFTWLVALLIERAEGLEDGDDGGMVGGAKRAERFQLRLGVCMTGQKR